MAIHGVNLGGWLVLEEWMTPSLFAGTSVPDEYGLSKLAQKDAAIRQRLENHRRTFITEADFIWLAKQGITAVRIPVGYWLFGDELSSIESQPYLPTVKYLDRAFKWAEKHHLQVLVSLHGAPGSQNGEMHSGRQGSVTWHQDPSNSKQTLLVIQKITERYHQSPAFLGIGLLNEPAASIPKKVLRAYYRQAYQLIRSIAGQKPWVVITDIYRPKQWNWSLARPFYRQVYLDTHQYQIFTAKDKAMDLPQHLKHTKGSVKRLLMRLRWHHPVIVGEWSVALDAESLKNTPKADRAQPYRQYYKVQLDIYDKNRAWFYWNYKVEASKQQVRPWDFRALTEAESAVIIATPLT